MTSGLISRTCDRSGAVVKERAQSRNGIHEFQEHMTVMPMNSIGRLMAARMTVSQQEFPQFALEIDLNLSALVTHRGRLKAEHGITASKPPSYTVFFVKALASALKRHERVNSQFAGDKILIPSYSNIGVAMNTKLGLVVPVVHRADMLSLGEITTKMEEYREKARVGRFDLDDLSGGTFTLTNLGMHGIDRFRPLINPPQAAILAVGRILKKAVVNQETDEISVQPMMSLTLVGDHRVIDGAEGADFLRTLSGLLSKPKAIC